MAQLVHVTTLQRLQNHFAAMANISICVCDPGGRLITSPTWASAFLRTLTRTAAGRKLCEDSIRLAATHASAEEVPLAIEGGVSLYGTPIQYRGHRLGTLVIGVRPPKKFSQEIVRNLAALGGVDPQELWQAAEQVPSWTAQDRKATFQFVDLLAETIATIYTQALQIRKQLNDLQIVHELAQLLTGEYDLNSILDQTARRVVSALNVKACGIRILDENTGELVIRAVHGLSEEYLRKPPILLENNEIDLAAFQGRAVFIEDARTDPRIRFREKSAREGIVSGLCVPLTHRGRTVGVLRVYTGERRYFGPDEIELVRSIAAQAAAAIINSRLAEERIQADQLQRQLRNAAQVQRRMIPRDAPRHPGLEVGSVYSPTLEVGGDFFDFVEMPDGGLGLGIADVVGKGVPAALMMASIRSVMRTYAMQGRRPADVLLYLNHSLCRDTEPNEFATLFFGVVNSETTSMAYANAGHEPPLLLRGDRFLRLETGGLVLGAFNDAHYADAETPLLPGDILVLTTDGTTEAMSFEGEVFGRPRLRESILRHRDLSAPQMAAQILWDIRRFAGLKEQSDDIALVVLKILRLREGAVSPDHPEG